MAILTCLQESIRNDEMRNEEVRKLEDGSRKDEMRNEELSLLIAALAELSLGRTDEPIAEFLLLLIRKLGSFLNSSGGAMANSQTGSELHSRRALRT